ncbi:hypothetical protein OBBRIDRAFT_790936 [Obba rivulosa]|uniref:Uncharacterized protein n=1 Tax=Obba rivulosa TaxID=1052685 RepID=A0A8E2AX94_9APHY|nr:hypothetical protein OBBRIDRAFT_790936 [Obba rivulosa]
MSNYAYASSSKHAQYYPSSSYPSGSSHYYPSTPYPSGLSQLPPMPMNCPGAPYMSTVPLPKVDEDRELAYYREQLSASKGDPARYEHAKRDIRRLEAELTERRRRQREIVAGAYDAQMREAQAKQAPVPVKFATPSGVKPRHDTASHRHALPSPPPSPCHPYEPYKRSSGHRDSTARYPMTAPGGSAYPAYPVYTTSRR